MNSSFIIFFSRIRQLVFTGRQNFLNPLMAVPPITAREEPWPFFLFWRQHFWLKLASSILNFCRRKRSFQWCPDQSDRPNGNLAEIQPKNHQNVQKMHFLQKVPGVNGLTELLYKKNFPLDDQTREANGQFTWHLYQPLIKPPHDSHHYSPKNTFVRIHVFPSYRDSSWQMWWIC